MNKLFEYMYEEQAKKFREESEKAEA